MKHRWISTVYSCNFLRERLRSILRLRWITLLLMLTLASALPWNIKKIHNSEVAQDNENSESALFYWHDESIEKLFQDELIIDGLLNYNKKVDPECRKNCDLETIDLALIKSYTGINVGSLTIPRPFEKLVAIYNYVNFNQSEGGLVIRTFNDLERAQQLKKFGIIFYAQKHAQLNGNVAPIKNWFDKGLRIVQIHYSGQDGPSQTVLEKLGGGSDEFWQGLTELGRKVVRRLNSLNMIIDVSHCSEKTTHDVIQLSNAPIMANHANSKTLTPVSRNKSDSEMLEIAQTGGMIGITPIAWMIDRDGDGEGNIDDFIAHIDYIIRLVGIDHVGVASDSVLDGWGMEDSHYSDVNLARMIRWKIVAWKLKFELGYSDESLKKIFGQNFQKFYERVMPGLIRPELVFPLDNANYSFGDINFEWSTSEYRGLENTVDTNNGSLGRELNNNGSSRLSDGSLFRSEYDYNSLRRSRRTNRTKQVLYDLTIEKKTDKGYVLELSRKNLLYSSVSISGLPDKTKFRWFVLAHTNIRREEVESKSYLKNFMIQ